MEQNQNRIALEAATGEPASPLNAVAADAELTDFDPVPLRYRKDGLTPEKQREFVEALADCGVAKHAAARIGVSEQAIARVRRRGDARAFDLACEAAQRFGARRIRSVAYERAIEGTVKRHFYHGELKSEEVVFDNRLLVYLLGKTAHLVEPPPEAQAVADNWEPWMEAIQQGLPAPDADAGAGTDPRDTPDACSDEEIGPADEINLWRQDGRWWTDFPPPAGFEGEEIGTFGRLDYRRTLSETEQERVDEWDAREHSERLAVGIDERDRFFGFAGGSFDDSDTEEEKCGGGEVFSPREAETYETSGPAGGRRAAGPLAWENDEDLPDEPRGGPGTGA